MVLLLNNSTKMSVTSDVNIVHLFDLIRKFRHKEKPGKIVDI